MPPRTRKAVAVDPQLLSRIAGRYQITINNDTIPLVMQFQSGVLTVQAPPFGPAPMRLYAADSTRFFTTDAPAEFAIERDASGAVIAVQLLNVGQPIRAMRVP